MSRHVPLTCRDPFFRDSTESFLGTERLQEENGLTLLHLSFLISTSELPFFQMIPIQEHLQYTSGVDVPQGRNQECLMLIIQKKNIQCYSMFLILLQTNSKFE
ncbi:hypothetical protein Avbf_03389 [Armadillidium vulgare]|nr:hypothetical protein Avbf_03389 [Armadillidium vulgare]